VEDLHKSFGDLEGQLVREKVVEGSHAGISAKELASPRAESGMVRLQFFLRKILGD